MKKNEITEEGQRAVVSRKKTSEQQEKRTEKIDGKKLVIYSEIMKPKFDEV